MQGLGSGAHVRDWISAEWKCLPWSCHPVPQTPRSQPLLSPPGEEAAGDWGPPTPWAATPPVPPAASVGAVAP
jgi:hypothetical protein